MIDLQNITQTGLETAVHTAPAMPDIQGLSSNIPLADMLEQAEQQKQVAASQAKAKEKVDRATRIANSAFLYGQEDDFKKVFQDERDMEYLVSDRAKANPVDQDHLVGGMFAREGFNGDLYRAIDTVINMYPEEERDALRAGVREKCGSKYDAKVYLGGLLRKRANSAYEQHKQKKAEFERGVKEYGEQMAVALPKAVLTGQPIDAEVMEKATRYGDAGNVIASLERARGAIEVIRTMQHGGLSDGEYDAIVGNKARKLKEDWYKSVHWRWTSVPTDDDFLQQAKADEAGRFTVSRDVMRRVVASMKGDDGKLDERALALMVLALDADAQGQQTIDSKYMRNFGEGLRSWFLETVDFVNRGNAKNGIIWQGHDMMPIYLSDEDAADFRDAYSSDVEKLKAALSMIENNRLKASDKAGLLSQVLTELGTVTGASAPAIVTGMMTGGVGGFMASTAILAPSSMNRDIAKAYYDGKPNAELDGAITGFFESAAEVGFGTAVSKVPLMGRFLDRMAVTGMGSKAIATTFSKMQGNAFARFVGDRVIGESVGELLGEEILSQTGSYITINAFRALGVDMDAPEWKPFSAAWENITDYRQSMATVAFCSSLGMLGMRADIQASRRFAKRTDAMLAAGITPQSAAMLARKAEEAEGKIARLTSGAGANPDVERRAEEIWEKEYMGEARKVYQKEVVDEDPVKLRNRLAKEKQLYMGNIEAEAAAREGVLQAALREAGVVAKEQTMDGKYRVTVEDSSQIQKDSAKWEDGKRPKDYETPLKEVEMTESQLAAWAQYSLGNEGLRRMKEIRSAALALDMADKVDKSSLGYARMLPLTSAAAPVAVELSKSHGTMSLPVLRALAKAARMEGANGAQILPGVSNVVTEHVADALEQRLDVAVQLGEITASAAEAAREGGSGVGAAAMRLPSLEGAASRIVYNPGHTQSGSIAEDAVEAMLTARLKKDGGMTGDGALTAKGKAWLENMLAEMRAVDKAVRAETGKGLMQGIDSASSDLQTVTEYFSHFAKSNFYRRAGAYGISEAARRHVDFMDSALMQGRFLEMLDKGFMKWIETKEGQEWEKSGGTLASLLRDAGHELGSLYNNSRVTAENVAAVEQARAYMHEAGEVTLADVERTLKLVQEEQEERDNPVEVSHVVPAEDSITGEEIPDDGGEASAPYTADGELIAPVGAEVQVDVDAKGKGLVNGQYAVLPDGSMMGVANVDDIGLCPDVPQFKTRAVAGGREKAKEDGTTHELSGGFRKDAPPITVWRRKDGALQVITGRHRLAHARKCGEPFISVRVYDEDAVHDAAWAKLYDVEMNILDRTAGAQDVAYFFRNTNMSLAEAEARGLMPRRKDGEQTATGTVGIAVALNACDEVYTRFINGALSERNAYFIATLGVDAPEQELALKLLTDKKPKSLEYVKSYVATARQQRELSDAPALFDLFGNDESWAQEADKLARYVESLRRQLHSQMNILQGAGSLKRKGEAAGKLGVKVRTPRDLPRTLAQMTLLDEALERMDSDLGLGALAAAWDGKSVPDMKGTGLMEYGATLAASASLDIGSMALESVGGRSRTEVRAALVERARKVQPFKDDKRARTDVPFDRAEYDSIETNDKLTPEEKMAAKVELAKKNFEAVYALAEECKDEFCGILTRVAQQLGLKSYLRTSLKGIKRASEKTAEDYDCDAGKCLDINGGTFVLNDDTDPQEIIDAIREAGMDIVCVKNGYLSLPSSGYQDMKLNLRMPNGFVGELIIIEQNMSDVKGGDGHKIYEALRSLEPIIKNSDDLARVERLKRMMDSLNALSTALYQEMPAEKVSELYEAALSVCSNEAKNASRVEGTKSQNRLSRDVMPPLYPSNILPREGELYALYQLSSLSLAQTTSVSTSSKNDTSSTSSKRLLGKGAYDISTPSVSQLDEKSKNFLQDFGSFSLNAEIDARYMDAVERGDMEEAGRMVREYAAKRGYIPQDKEYWMNHRPMAEGTEKKTPEQRMEDGDALSILDLAQGYWNVPKDFFEHPDLYDTQPGSREAAYKVRDLIERAKKWLRGESKTEPCIKCYRAVPKDVKEDTPRNGDWVTPSREYAEEHIRHSLDGKGRVQVFSAKVSELYFNGDSVMEFGYHDGNDYAYRNTKNNRKLLAPVTYEDVEVRAEDGEFEGVELGEWNAETKRFDRVPYRYNMERRVVPLSKRFNPKENSVSFSVSPTLHDDLTAASENKLKAKSIIPLCSCPPVLVALGQKKRDVVTMAHVIRKIATKHGMKPDEIKRAMDLLQDPMFVVQDSADSFIFIPGMLAALKDGRLSDVEVPIKLEHTDAGDHYMLSMYPLESLQKLKEQLSMGHLVYSKYNKIALGSTNYAPGLSPDLVRLVVAQGFNSNTITSEDIVKQESADFPGSFSVTTAEQQQWEAEAGRVMDARENSKRRFHIMKMPTVLRLLGCQHPYLDIEADTIMKAWVDGEPDKRTGHKHNLTREQILRLPVEIADPVMVFEGKADTPKFRSLVVLTEMKVGEKSVMAAVHLDKRLKNTKVDVVASAYERENNNLFKTLKPLYVDTNRVPSWHPLADAILAGEGGLRNPDGSIILTKEDIVKQEPGISMSLQINKAAQDAVQPYGKEAVMESMVRRIEQAGRMWSTSFAGREPMEARDAVAEQMGQLMAMAAGIYRALPDGYRVRLEPMLRRGQVFANMLESGKLRSFGKISKEQRAALEEEIEAQMDTPEVWTAIHGAVADSISLGGEVRGGGKKVFAEAYAREHASVVREVAQKNLVQLYTDMAQEAAGQMKRYLRDQEVKKIAALVERFTPKVGKNGKMQRGKLEASMYRKLARLVQMMQAPAKVREENIAALQGRIAEAEKAGDEGKCDTLTVEQMEWSTYGAVGSQSLEAARKARAELLSMLGNGSARWEAKLADEKASIDYLVDLAVRGMGEADDSVLANMKDTGAKASMWQKLKRLPAYSQSIGQLLYGLAGVPGLGRLADESSRAITRGHLALAARENALQEAMGKKLEELGFATNAAKADFIKLLKEKVDTGIVPMPDRVPHRVKLSLEDARRWVEMDKAARDKERERLKRQETETERKVGNVPQEEDIALLRDELAKAEGGKRGRKWVTVEREVNSATEKKPLCITRDAALNLLLLCEQERYHNRNAASHGYTDEVLGKLRDFVGEKALAFGYWMRDYLSGTGLAEVFEEREGVPFPAEENYWPGVFDQSGRVNENVNALDPSSGQCSTRYSMLMLRVNHNLNFDLSIGATNAFMGAIAMQNNYICMGGLTAKWRRLLGNQRFARSLRQKVGESTFQAIKDGINLLDGQGVAEAYSQKAMSGIIAQFQRAHAPAVLAGATTTLIKQFSALMHASCYPGVSPIRLVRQLVSDRFGGGKMTYGRMMQEAVFKERCGDKAVWEEMLTLGADVKWSRLAAWSRAGMNWLERADVAANCASMTALYNIIWKRLEKTAGMTDEERHAHCMEAVERTMDLAAQPTRRSQKSLSAAVGGGGVWNALNFYMASEVMNKVGMMLANYKRGGGGLPGFKGALKFLVTMSCAEQIMCMVIDLLRGTGPDVDDDETWAMWLACNAATGLSGAGLASGVPILGGLLQHATGGYVKTASISDALGLDVVRNGKKIYKMTTDKKHHSMAEWALQLLNISRAATGALGSVSGGTNSSIQFVNSATALLQSVNMAGNVVRPVLQRVENSEKSRGK